jgi:hypothetical protein
MPKKNTTQRLHVYISAKTEKQIRELAATSDQSCAKVVSQAVDSLYQMIYNEDLRQEVK